MPATNNNYLQLLFFLFGCILLLTSGCQQKKQAVLKSPAYLRARALDGVNDDSAFYLYSQVVHSSSDSFEIGSSYNRMALLQWTAGDFFGSEESALASQSFLRPSKESDLYWIASNYGILGKASLDLQQYAQAIAYFDSALHYEVSPVNDAYYLNNKAVAFEKVGRYDEAIQLYQTALAQQPDSLIEYARVLSNLAIVQWMKDSSYPAAAPLHRALAIRQSNLDDWGLNASYAQLSSFHAKRRPDSALYFARQMYATAQVIGSAVDQLEALDKLIQLAPPAQASGYFNRYLQLNDSLQQARNAAKNQFAIVRYDAEKSKADNLVLQKDNAEKVNRIERQRLLFFSVLSIFILSVLLALLWYKKRKERFRLEAANALQEQQLRLSKKVHDVVANGLYRLMSEIEHTPLAQAKLLDKMETLYEQSRDLSYEKLSPATDRYEQQIQVLLAGFSSPRTKVLIVGNEASFWKGISRQTREELEFILQELLINMKKHSQANNVVLKFEQDQLHRQIRYTDDGVGLSAALQTGNGLRNTENRILAIGGTISFDDRPGKGFGVTISFTTTTDDN